MTPMPRQGMPAAAPRLGRGDFDTLRRMILELTGIQLTDEKQSLVSGRLSKRLRVLELETFKEYIDLVRSDTSGDETRELINCITTNKTSFFREPHHFELLAKTVIPAIAERARRGGAKRIRIWSAGCSSGQEPWSIAMVVRAALGSLAGWDIRILASDLDTNILSAAEEAIYDESAILDVPHALREAGFERLGDGRVRVVAPLRGLVAFRQLNLVHPPWPIRTKFDAIFCRNVAIYFDRPTQRKLFEGLARLLDPEGYLFAGHSENLHWLSEILTSIGGTVHRLTDGAAAPHSKARRSLAPHSKARRSLAPHSKARRSLAPHAKPRNSLAPHAKPRNSLAPHAKPRTGPPVGKDVPIVAGGLHASAQGDVIRTLLGSCVAVCLYDPVARVGGMNHFMLPDGHNADRNAAAFGVNAMELVINAMMKCGGDRRRFVAKVFGASTLRAEGAGFADIAPRNAKFALEFLADEEIPVAAQKLGGRSALSVRFDTATGRALVREIDEPQEVARTEIRLRATLSHRPPRPIEDDIFVFGESP